MNDPHVAALLYRVEHGESFDYKEAKPLVCDKSPAFHLEVKDKQVRFELKEHYATEEDAREAIEEYIRVWEFDAALKKGPDAFRLRFDKAEIVDRNPTPGVLTIRGTITGEPFKLSGGLILGFRKYPSPPSDFSLLGLLDPNAQTMFDRYMNYRRGGEPLPGAAYFCLTVLENMAEGKKRDGEGKRKAVSRYFQFDKDVLAEIGRLSSTKGGPAGARKSGGVSLDLTDEERRFLEEAVKKMIRRAAEKAHSPDADLPKIKLSDLPPI